jgi:hypothetical protein
MLKLWLNYRLADTLAAEVSTGQVQGVFSGTELWSLSLTSEPWSDQRWSPFLSVGVGQFRNIPNNSLVDAAPVNANWRTPRWACAGTSRSASRRGWTGRSTPPSWPTSAAPNTAPSAPAWPSSSNPLRIHPGMHNNKIRKLALLRWLP